MQSKTHRNMRTPAPQREEWDPNETLDGYEVEELTLIEATIMMEGGRIVFHKRVSEGEEDSES